MKYIVTGLGRCGSSLMMQMLEAAGISVTGEYPAFEHQAGSADNFDAKWLRDADEGVALKILDFQRDSIRLPKGDYKIIAVRREARHQARSHAKFLRWVCGIQTTPGHRKNIEKSLVPDFRRLLRKAAAVNGSCLVINFEDFFWTPEVVCKRVTGYLDLPSEAAEKMLRVIVPRHIKARPNMNLELNLIHQRGRQS